MSNFQVISRERHASRRWRRFSSYAFGARESIVPLVAAELPRATMALPIGFIEQAGGFAPVAVLGLQPGRNLFVAADGRWVGSYTPAAFRSYPFGLARTEDGQQVLCIDEDSGLVTDGQAGERFFAEDGQPAQAVLDILNFLNLIEQSRLATTAACGALQKHELIQPWPITLKTGAGEQTLTGLFRVDEAALNQLPAEALHEVRQAGALPLAFCQLLSMQHLSVLARLAEAHAQTPAQGKPQQGAVPGADLDLEFLNKNGTISFGSLG